MAAMLWNVVVVFVVFVVGHTPPRSTPLAILTMKQGLHGYVILFLELWCSLGGTSGGRSSAINSILLVDTYNTVSSRFGSESCLHFSQVLSSTKWRMI